MTTAKKSEPIVSNDVDALDPAQPTHIDSLVLSSGTTVNIEKLRTRQLFKLLKILTRGAGPLLGELDLDPNGDADNFVTQLLTLIAFSIPEAEDEAIEFIQSMVTDPRTIARPRNKDEKATNAALQFDLEDELANPELEDTLAIVEAIVKNEAGDIQSLGKRLISMLSVGRS